MLKKWFVKIDIVTAGVFVFYILLCFLDITAPAKMYANLAFAMKLLRYACYLVFALRFVYDTVKYRELAVGAVIMAGIAAVNILTVGEMKLGFTVLALAAIRRLDCNRLIKWLFFALTSFFVAVMLLSVSGLIPDWTYMRDETVRHSLGFIYPTDAFSVFLVTVMLYFCTYRDKISVIAAAGIMAVNVFMYVATDGRLSFILVTLVIASMVVYKLFAKRWTIGDKLYKPLKICLVLLPVLLLVATILLTLLYKNGSGVGDFVNKLLSDRLKHGANALLNYPVRPFGTYVEWVGFGGHGYVDTDVTEFVYNYVDMSYLRLLLDFGVVVTAVVTALYTKLMYDTVTKKDVVFTIVLTVVLLWVFIEPHMFNVGRNIFVVYLAKYMSFGTVKLGFLNKR